MPSSGLQAATLRRAVEITGGIRPLAAHLGTSTKRIEAWLNGMSEVPWRAFSKAAELITEAEISGLLAGQHATRPADRRRGMYRTAADGHCLFVDDALGEIFGMPAEQAVGLGWIDSVHPDDRERLARRRKEAIAGSESFEVRYRILRGMEVIWITARSTAVMKEDGAFAGRIGEITEE